MKTLTKVLLVALVVFAVSCRDNKKEEAEVQAQVEQIDAIEKDVDQLAEEVDQEVKDVEEALKELDN